MQNLQPPEIPKAWWTIYDLPGKTLATIKSRVFTKCHQFWRKNYRNWEESKLQICELKHFRKFWPEIDASKSNKLMNLVGNSRRNFSIFVQTASGADYLNKYNYKIGETNSPCCDQCNEEETDENLLHLLTECPAMTGTALNTFTKFPVMVPSCHPVTQIVRFLLESNIDFLPTEQDIN